LNLAVRCAVDTPSNVYNLITMILLEKGQYKQSQS